MSDDPVSEKMTGRVKWFNNKTGYGFVTVTDGPKAGTDIFTHHSAIKVDSEQYRYLVQGEYIDFTIISTPDGKHEFQATNICGIKGGKLMCETRNEFKASRVKKVDEKEPEKKQRSVRPPNEGKQ